MRKKIAIIGFRGIGKTSISKILSEAWGIPLISLDDYIEEQEKMTIEEIVKKKGWNYFRKLELRYLEDIAKDEKACLLDTGGGIVEGEDFDFSDEKTKILRENYFIVYIHMETEKIIDRISKLNYNSQRPKISSSEEQLLEIIKRRKPWYQKIAHAIVDITDTKISESAQRVIELLKK
ncbi:MAG: shikimate kinase [Spirochaetia bacterium]|nr:shikimate kinase [Spirochaetia bacterium]